MTIPLDYFKGRSNWKAFKVIYHEDYDKVNLAERAQKIESKAKKAKKT
jgi:hypothetical protein